MPTSADANAGEGEEGARPSIGMSAQVLADYIVEIGEMLVKYGCPSHRLEEVIRVVAEIEGYSAQALALPTGLLVTLSGDRLVTPALRMARVKQSGVDLGRLVLVDAIFNDVAARRVTIEAAREKLRRLANRPPLYSPFAQGVAIAIASATGAVFFRGGWFEVMASFIAGGAVATFGMMSSRNPQARFLVDFSGGMAAAVAALILTSWRPELSREVVVLSGVITLVPGMTLTTGLSELAQKQLVSGAARMAEALIVLLLIVFGIALVVGLERILPVPVQAAGAREGFGVVGNGVAMLVAALSFAVLFSMPRKFVWAAVLSGSIAWITTAIGTRYLPAHVAAFAAALAICAFANIAARATQRPAQLFLLPGIILLVPGSFGFLSLESFLRGEFLDGAAKGFQMILTAGALVTGILVANVLVPPRKLL